MSKKVDLDLLKKLVSELEASLSHADEIRVDSKSEHNAHIVELSKAIGLCTGISHEANALIVDITYSISGGPATSSKDDLLNKLIFNTKSNKSNKNGN